MEGTTFPKKYQSLYRKDPEYKNLGVDETTLNEICPNEVLIKMAYSPVHPADLMLFLHNKYGNPSEMPKGPVIGGFEGAGTVEAVGSNLSSDMIGSKVGMFLKPANGKFYGTWSEYVVTEPTSLFFFPDEARLDRIHSSFANPVSSLAIVERLIAEKAESVIFNAGAGQVCRMATRLCKENGIRVLTIVRRDQHIKEMLSEGSQIVLNCKSPSYVADLQKAVDELKPVHFFDSVSGGGAVRIFECMPKYSTLFSYGALSEEPFEGLSPYELIFKKKIIR